eukprot:CAMPEP_0118991526 /NCGR_PEP_ID=MMETSP1173-20130426/51760_1 /TAXON_ID=1034831 /ORGANISM="Rhizochromulina marina cf, Strain CCMP1243" /LENGTH=76 /DNA_ID=CAMNT_0006942655 /DNA_START=638 /DNA_END=865 /DNA_ORIENTATION=+
MSWVPEQKNTDVGLELAKVVVHRNFGTDRRLEEDGRHERDAPRHEGPCGTRATGARKAKVFGGRGRVAADPEVHDP